LANRVLNLLSNLFIILDENYSIKELLESIMENKIKSIRHQEEPILHDDYQYSSNSKRDPGFLRIARYHGQKKDPGFLRIARDQGLKRDPGFLRIARDQGLKRDPGYLRIARNLGTVNP
jgi:hypothetical protein